jgi:hypothetical protein
MPTWQAIVVFCFALATTMYFKFVLPEADRGDAGFDEQDTRIARLKRYRMEHGACIYCGEPLAYSTLTLTSSVCDHCRPDV